MEAHLVFLQPMKVFYRVFIFFYGLGLRLAALFDEKAREFVAGRRNIFTRIADAMKGNTRPVIWMHCASLGEFEQGRPVIEALRSEFPHYRIFLTFFSPSGYRVRKNYPGADDIFYLPLDTKRNARRFVRLVKPAVALFVKYEFWHYYTQELKKQQIPLLSISAIFRPGQYFFRKTGSFNRRILRNVTHFFVQNQQSVELLQSINLYNVTLSGDTRFDRVMQIARQASEVEIAKAFKGNERVFAVGSAWPDDLEVLLPFINENRLKFIVAPHEIHEQQIADFERALTVPSIRYSQAAGQDLEAFSVLIIDNVGLLSRLYRYGEFAYVGGAFGKGLHNILEAACYGIPVLFGNRNYEKFQEAVDLTYRGGAFPVADYPDLKSKFEMLNTPETFVLACEVSRQYVRENTGATDKILDYLRNMLGRS